MGMALQCAGMVIGLAMAVVPVLTVSTGCGSTSAVASVSQPLALSKRVQRLAPAVSRLLSAPSTGERAWAKLEYLALRIGPRLSGSDGMSRAIAWAQATLKADGQENVRVEPVMVPSRSRGLEALQMLSPAQRSLPLLGLGGTVSTPEGGLLAQVEVVRSEADVLALGAGARGKLLLIDVAMPPYHPEHGTGYGAAVKFRYVGPKWAARAGAAGVLMRSLTARSLATPHTGATSYKDLAIDARVPAAAITTEDSAAIAALRAKGVPVEVRLKLGGRDLGWVPSANVTAELVGRERPDEVVVISAHLDAWDVGHGAHDDGGGCVMAMEALSLIRRAGLRPRRTIRVVLWTNEENGLRGAHDYGFGHTEDLALHVAAVEADSGAYAPKGYRVQHGDKTLESTMLNNVGEIVGLAQPLGAGRAKVGFSGADVRTAMMKAGVPLLGHWMDMSRYFDIHHTHADTLDKVDSEELRRNVLSMAIMAYALAELPGRVDGRESAPAPTAKALSTMSQLAWLGGQWVSQDGTQEVWAAPHGQTMIGMAHGPTKNGRIKGHERMRIATDRDGVLTLWAQPHGAKEPVPFTQKPAPKTGKRELFISFENSAHDFPQSIRYRRAGDLLTTTVSGPGRAPMSRSFRRVGDVSGLGWLPHGKVTPAGRHWGTLQKAK